MRNTAGEGQPTSRRPCDEAMHVYLITFTAELNRHLRIASVINNSGRVVGLLSLGKPLSEQHGLLLLPTAP